MNYCFVPQFFSQIQWPLHLWTPIVENLKRNNFKIPVLASTVSCTQCYPWIYKEHWQYGTVLTWSILSLQLAHLFMDASSLIHASVTICLYIKWANLSYSISLNLKCC